MEIQTKHSPSLKSHYKAVYIKNNNLPWSTESCSLGRFLKSQYSLFLRNKATIHYLLLLAFFGLLSGSADIGEVSNDLLCIFSLACTRFSSVLGEQNRTVSGSEGDEAEARVKPKGSCEATWLSTRAYLHVDDWEIKSTINGKRRGRKEVTSDNGKSSYGHNTAGEGRNAGSSNMKRSTL